MTFIFRALALFILILIAPQTIAAPFAYITNFGGGTVSVIDTANNAVVDTIPVPGGPYGVAVSPDGSLVYIGRAIDKMLSTIDTSGNAVKGNVAVGKFPIGVAITPDASKVYVANYLDVFVSVVDTASNTVIETITVGKGPAGVTVSPNGSRVYVANYDDNTVSVIDTNSNTVVGAAIAVGTAPLGILVSPDGSRLIVANSDTDTVSIIDTATNLVIGTVDVGDRPIDLAITPDSSKVYITHSDNDVVQVVDTASQSVIAVIPVGDRPIGLDITPDGRKVYVANDTAGTVSVIDTSTNTVTDTVTVGARPFAFGQFIGPALSYTVGGSVSGLTSSVTLQNNSADALTVNADGSFTFATTLVNGSAYNVTVLTQPVNQTCSVSNGSGTISAANVTNVAVTCVDNPRYTVGGLASGLTSSVTLQNNSTDDLTVNADGSFTFATALVNGSAYNVTVLTQPVNQTCSVSNGSGTISAANVTNVAVTCLDNPRYAVGGLASGLTSSVTLQNNSTDDLTVNADGSFTFATALVNGSAYNVTVLTQPMNQTCSVSNGSGTISAANVTNVAVTCVDNPRYTVGGLASGLTSSVTLQNNSTDDLTVNADGSFTFATTLVNGSAYNVTVLTQPVNQTCSVSNGSGTISAANVTNVAVVCVTIPTPPPPVRPIPTFSARALMILSLLLGFVVFTRLNRLS